MTGSVKPVRALLSVSDKSGLVAFATILSKAGIELLSTGGTSSALRNAGLTVTDVAEVTAFPEIMDGRVKTLHPRIHGGLLGRRDNPDHEEARDTHGIPAIDIVVANLYPFEATRSSGADMATIIENIDIGGPAMIRAAAKNHDFVTVVTSPEDYGHLAQMIQNHGMIDAETRRALAQKAFARTAAYDTAIATWLAEVTDTKTPDHRTFGGKKLLSLRYGENPHQQAALYQGSEDRLGVASAEIVQGKPLSYNNLNDTDAAFECVSEFGADAPAVVIVKHANPCGVAQADSIVDAYKKALACDGVSAFGGIIAANSEIDLAAAEAITSIFTEVVIAPSVSDEARAIFAKKPNLRLLVTGGLPDPNGRGTSVKSIAGGFLVQDRDALHVSQLEFKTVTKRMPTFEELADMKFAFMVAKHVKSNTIVYAKDRATVGIGAGQMSRIDSARIAARKAEDAAEGQGLKDPLTRGSVVASDAFFPFADGLLVAIEAGATAVIQPGGSMRDDDVISAADEAGIAMVLTGARHFRH